MKNKSILFTVLVLFFVGQVNSQTYQAFPTVDGYWKVQYGNVNCVDIHGVSSVCSEYQYIVTGDTIISNKTYRKISLSGKDRNPVDETWTFWSSGYHGCYRNDIVNKRVYYIPKGSINEILLYDFNLSLNDTLPETFVYNQSENTTITVDQIDSVLINNTYLKRYHLDNAGFGGQYLIEGMGSTLGLLSPITPFFEYHFALLCFKNDYDSLCYQDYNDPDCDLITGVQEENSNHSNIEIFPNPATHYLRIENPQSRDVSFEIFNSKGQKVKTIRKKENSDSIDISELDVGLYFIRISVSGIRIKTLKLIKE